MENRFGIKDLVNLLLLVMIVVLLGLQMIQKDRQWVLMQQLKGKIESQSNDLTNIRQALSGGVTIGNRAGLPRPTDTNATGTTRPETTGTEPATDATDPFARLREGMKRPDFAMGDWCVDAFGSEINTLTPLISTDAYASIVQGFVQESLANLDPETLAWQPMLAVSWKPVDHSEAYFAWRKPVEQKLRAEAEADPSVYRDVLATVKKSFEDQLGRAVKSEGEEWEQLQAAAKQQWIDKRVDDAPDRPVPFQIEFQMRPGAAFSDGVPVTAYDVEFTFNLVMNPKIAAPRQRSAYEAIQSVKAESDDRVVFTFRRPYFRALDLAAEMPVMPAHFYKPVVDRDPEQFNRSRGLLVGSGPYMLEDPKGWQPGGQVVLVRNQRYWGPASPLNRQVFRLFTLDQARQVAFRNGELDMFGASPEQYVDMLKDKSLSGRANSYEYMTPYNGYRFIAWNQLGADHKPSRFADQRVRQALTMLLNRPRMLKDIMRGYGQVCDGPFNPLGEQNAPEVTPWPYDVKGARALLKEAGYEDRDGDGVIEGSTGQPFRFKLTYPSGNVNYQSMVFFVKDALAEGGIVLEPDPLEWSVMVDRLNNHNFEAITLMWTSGPETDINQMFHSDQIRPGGDNFVAYRNSRLDMLITQARLTVDKDKRMEMWRECHRILHADQPYTFLFWGKSLRFVDKRFKNVRLLKAGLTPRTEWYAPKAEQHWKE
ncbi:MAG: ABC transporter substrate-binding protein [Phycisphaeraceae bacterium]